MKKKKIIAVTLISVFAALAVFTGMMAYWQWNDQHQSTEEFSSLAELIEDTTAEPSETETPTDGEVSQTDSTSDAAYLKYEELYNRNNDFVGWISIDGTGINYPVMQTIHNPDYYLKHSFEKTYSDYGVPYVDEGCAVGLSMNTVVYGHHMKNGTMFSSLVNYEDKSYFEAHPIINFDTFYGLGKYQVIAAFAFDVSRETFRYNEFADGNKQEFDKYVSECMARRAYDTGFSAEFGDKLLTLSTCEYTHQNGRFVVVAKLINE